MVTGWMAAAGRAAGRGASGSRPANRLSRHRYGMGMYLHRYLLLELYTLALSGLHRSLFVVSLTDDLELASVLL